MKICVIGGGNIGTLISAELSLSREHQICLFASKAHLFSNEIIIEDKNDNVNKIAKIDLITSDIEKAIKNSKIILITVPANIIPITIERIYPFLETNTLIGIIPGSGGAEFCLKKVLEKGCTIFGIQRVHSIARFKEYGKIIINQSRKNQLEVAAIPKDRSKSIGKLLESLFNMPCIPLNNYLNVTFTPSNQILHTSRLYCLFKDYEEGTIYREQGYFYKDWNNYSSEILIACDNELQQILKALPEFDLTGVKSLLKHYEVNDIYEMTQKISHIPAFQNIMNPMIEKDGKYYPDRSSRYFIADFPYGLCIIKGFAEILDILTPNIDMLLKWYEKFANVEYFVGKQFIGKDLANTGIPQNYGIYTRRDIINFYS